MLCGIGVWPQAVGMPAHTAPGRLSLLPTVVTVINRRMDRIIGPIARAGAEYGCGSGFGQKGAKSAKKLLPPGRSAIIIARLVKQANGYHSYRCR